MNPAATLDAFEARLNKLERRNRILVACLAASVGIGIFTAAKTPSEPLIVSEIRTQRFVLLDSNGREVGRWETDDDGYPGISMTRGRFEPHFELTEGPRGWRFDLNSYKDGRMYCQVFPEGSSLKLKGKDDELDGQSELSLSALRHSSASFIAPNRARIAISPSGPWPIYSMKPGDNDKDWYFTRGSLNFNGLKLHLNDANGDPIQTLPQGSHPEVPEIPV